MVPCSSSKSSEATRRKTSFWSRAVIALASRLIFWWSWMDAWRSNLQVGRRGGEVLLFYLPREPRLRIVLRWWKIVSESFSGTSLKRGDGNAFTCLPGTGPGGAKGLICLRHREFQNLDKLPVCNARTNIGPKTRWSLLMKPFSPRRNNPGGKMLSSITCLDPKSRGYFYSWLAFTSAKLQKSFFHSD